MRIYQRYIAGSFLKAFVLSLLVLTFVMSIGLMFKATALVARGVSAPLVLTFIASGMPATFTFTIPLAALVGALLVFGRLSADAELAAMQACGISLRAILSLPLMLSLLLSLFCLYLNDRIGPDSHHVRRRMTREAGVTTALQLLEEGRWVQDFAGLMLWFARREDATLHDVLIFERTREGTRREVRAARAEVFMREDDLVFDMSDVRIEPFQADRPGVAVAERLQYVIADVRRHRAYRRDENDFHLSELISAVQTAGWENPEMTPDVRQRWISRLKVQLHRRLVLSIACFCFVLLGAPLGLRAHRRESTIGIAISLGIAMLFYLLLLVAQSLTRMPQFNPHLILWLPVLACLLLGHVLIRRAE